MTARLTAIQIDEISLLSKGVRPAVAGALVVIAKRAKADPAEAAQRGDDTSGTIDWSRRREVALEGLDRLAKGRAAARGESVAKAYAAIMETREGAELYRQAI